MSKQTIIVGLSGGVDSAVSALLLKEQGHDVIGIFMQNWEADKQDTHCHAEIDLTDARMVCDHLKIPFQTVNFAKDYWDNVFQQCLDEFVQGRTPNPDIWCNQYIKFDVFLQHALSLNADYLATGHYARIQKNETSYRLLKSTDTNKDQSYFLYTLNQSALSKTLFPLGDLTKPQVRDIAKKAGLVNFNKKDSTGICFIGERKFKDFLQNYILTKPGLMKTTEGEVIGPHDGLMFYTLGQRKGLHIGGRKNASDEAWYVIGKDIKQNVLLVAQGDHPLLYQHELKAHSVHWIHDFPHNDFTCTAKTRYRQNDQPCQVIQIDDTHYKVRFDHPQRSITPGQSIVFYQDEICLGGGIISDYE